MLNTKMMIMMPLIFGSILLSNCQAVAEKSENPLTLHVAESKLYALYKPALWKVAEDPRQDSLHILVNSPDQVSTVDFFWASNPQNKPNVLGLLGAYRKNLSEQHPGVVFSEIYASADSSRATATVSYPLNQGRAKGRYFFESTPKGQSVQGYTTLESRLKEERPLLLNVMASFAFSKAQPARAAQSNRQAFQPQFVELPLVSRQAPDRSLGLKIPEDWKFLAAGGKVIASGPNGGMGFIFTSIAGNPMLPGASIAQGVIGVPYQPPAQAIGTILRAFGHRDCKVHSSQPDGETNQQFLMTVGRRCDAQDLVVSWTSGAGAHCLGAFKLVNALPSMTRQWFCIMAGIWGPEQDFYRYYPLLEQIGSSFSINDQYARQYIRAGLDNLRHLQQQTLAAIQDLNRSREQNQTDWEAKEARKDFMDSKWDDYNRGNSYWISDLEGGKAYHTDNWGTKDTSTGDYYEGRGYNWTNFEGENPRYPSENMREVSSYELQKIMGRQ